MSPPNELQTLILWRLLSTDGGDFLKNIKPELKAKDRKSLEQAGLVEVEKRKEPNPKKGARAITYVSLSERGWEWAANHLDAKISGRSTAASPVLQAMMTKLKSHLQKQQVSLADFICGDAAGNGDDAVPDLAERIHAAYLQLGKGESNVRVRLAGLRGVLDDVPKEELDATLLEMERTGSVVLYPLDDPQEIGPDDEAAVLPNSAGFERHILYMQI